MHHLLEYISHDIKKEIKQVYGQELMLVNAYVFDSLMIAQLLEELERFVCLK